LYCYEYLTEGNLEGFGGFKIGQAIRTVNFTKEGLEGFGGFKIEGQANRTVNFTKEGLEVFGSFKIDKKFHSELYQRRS
jgi:hypothetical protein